MNKINKSTSPGGGGGGRGIKHFPGDRVLIAAVNRD